MVLSDRDDKRQCVVAMGIDHRMGCRSLWDFFCMFALTSKPMMLGALYFMGWSGLRRIEAGTEMPQS